MHIKNHPILGIKLRESIIFYFNDKPLEAYKNQTVAAALIANGIKKFGVSRKLNQSRGLYCAQGKCCSCYMTVDKEDHVRVCKTNVEDGMKVYPRLEDPMIRRDDIGN